MFEALWVHNGELEAISAEEALELPHYEDEQFNSSESEDIQERLKEENLEPLTEKEYNILFAVTPRKGCERTRKNTTYSVRPHFKRHFNIEDYREMFPDDTRRGEIIRNLTHIENSRWHNNWVSALGEFCDITEKRVWDEETGKYKYPDALCKATNTVFEVQHSYIGRFYEERNAFYKKLGYQIVWIIDCTKTDIYHDKQLKITENSCQSPIFKLLTFDIKNDDIIYAQMKDGKIYRVYNAKQSKDENGLGNAIWGFNPIEEYDNQDKFIEAIKDRVDYQNTVTEYHRKIEEEKAEQERQRKEQAEKEEEERLLKEKPNLCDVKLPPKYRMEARIRTTKGKKIDVRVCHFPDGSFTARKIKRFWEDLNWEDSNWYYVSKWFNIYDERSTKVIEIYTKPVLMNKYR